MFGGSLGLGIIDGPNCAPLCGGAGMVAGHIGGMLNPRLALMGDFWGLAPPLQRRLTARHDLPQHLDDRRCSTGSTDIVWLKGGHRLRPLQLEYDGESVAFDDESGLAIMGAAGVEVVQSYNFALDLQVRAGHGFYDGGDVNNFGLHGRRQLVLRAPQPNPLPRERGPGRAR